MKILMYFLLLATATLACPQDGVSLAAPTAALVSSGATTAHTGMTSMQGLASLPLQLPMNVLQGFIKNGDEAVAQSRKSLQDIVQKTGDKTKDITSNVQDVASHQLQVANRQLKTEITNINMQGGLPIVDGDRVRDRILQISGVKDEKPTEKLEADLKDSGNGKEEGTPNKEETGKEAEKTNKED